MVSRNYKAIFTVIGLLLLGIGIGWLCFGLPSRKLVKEAREQTAVLENELDTARSQLKALDFLRFRGDVPLPPRIQGGRSVLAEVVRPSEIPDPKTAPYRDCLAYCEVNLTFCDNETVSSAEPVPAIVGVPGFIDRIPTVGFGLKEGDWITGTLAEATAFSETDLATFSAADDTERFELPRYFLIGGKKLAGTAENRKVQTDGILSTRTQEIERALAEVENRKNLWGGDYQKWEAAAVPIRKDLTRRVAQGGGELAIGTQYSFFRALDWPPSPFPDDAVAALVSLNKQLRANGVDLLVVPFPPKNFANVDLFADGLEIPPGGLFPFRSLIFEQLLESGIEVIDLLPDLIAARPSYPQIHYDGKDHHPADGGIQVIGHSISRRLARYPFPPRFTDYQEVPLRYSIPEDNERFNPRSFTGDPYVAHRILPDAPDRKSVTENRVLLLGDSIITVPYRYGVPGALVANHLSTQTGYMPKMFRMSGSSPQILRHLAANPEVLDGVEVVIFCFSELYLYYDRKEGKRFEWEAVELP